MPKFCLLPLFEVVRQLGAAFSAPHRFVDAADGGFRRPYPYAFRLQGFHFAILLLWCVTIGHGDNCHNIRRLLL